MKSGPLSGGSNPPAVDRLSQVFDLPIGSWTAASGIAEMVKKRLPRRAVVVAVGPEILPMAVRWARRLEMTVAVVRRVASESASSAFAVAGGVEGKSCLILLEGQGSAEGLPDILETLRAAGARPDFRLLAPPAAGILLHRAVGGGRRFSDSGPVSATTARRGPSPRDQTPAVSPGTERRSRTDGTAPVIAAGSNFPL
jgi:hypothetical protein